MTENRNYACNINIYFQLSLWSRQNSFPIWTFHPCVPASTEHLPPGKSLNASCTTGVCSPTLVPLPVLTQPKSCSPLHPWHCYSKMPPFQDQEYLGPWKIWPNIVFWFIFERPHFTWINIYCLVAHLIWILDHIALLLAFIPGHNLIQQTSN